MFETILKPSNPLYHSSGYEESLQRLESRINSVEWIIPGDASDTTSDSKASWKTILELYKIAAMIYFKRSSRSLSGPSQQIDAMVDRAFVILDGMDTLDLSFPILIVGCEAWQDSRRKSVLELVERTRRRSCVGSLHGLRSILQRIWAQDDLSIGHELNYSKKLDVVISSYPIVPCFA